MATQPPPPLDSYPAVRDYLYSLKHHGAKYGIDRMRLLAAALDHPERRYPVIHAAGSNGKGSVCAMLEAVYRHAGYKTGLYTSPHLIRQGERVQVHRRVLEEADIVAYTRRLQGIANDLAARDPDDHPSFFEFMTAMAFLRFAEEAVDLGIIETGLGGRLDATNIVEPEVSVITSISLDHVDLLGDTLAAIAGEKAGIIKPGRPVVMGRLPPEAEAVIRRTAGERGCPLFSVRERFGEALAGYPETNLEGDYQRWNAGTATLVTEVLMDRFPVDPDSRAGALQRVDWAGRWQRMPLTDRTLILDATHNPEGAEGLDANLARLVEQTGTRPVIIAGTLGRFRAEVLMPVIARHAREIHLVVPRQRRACSVGELRACLPPDCGIPTLPGKVRDLVPQPGRLLAGEPGETVVATGSIYLLGELAERLVHAEPPDESHLQDTP
ncbi:MAG: bifunctional folylpolyglutamate synthase/dihydrofolate synthase [Opitutales bacterium]